MPTKDGLDAFVNSQIRKLAYENPAEVIPKLPGTPTQSSTAPQEGPVSAETPQEELTVRRPETDVGSA